MRDLKVEQYLDRGSYAYEYTEKVPIAKINKKKSRSNPSRAAVRLDEDRAIQYGLAMESGSDFPAIVLLKLENLSPTEADLLVVSGMHRLAGFELSGIAESDAYIINESDEYRIDSLLYSINNIEGRAPTQNEQILKLLALHEKYPHVSLSQLSREWCIKRDAIQNVAKVQRARQRAREAGYDLERIKITTEGLKAIGAIYDDIVFERVCRFINNHAPSGTHILELCKQIRESPRDQRIGLEIVKKCTEEAEFRQREQRAKIGRTPQGRAERYQSRCKSLLKETEEGLEHLHLSTLLRPGDLKIIWEALITTGKRVIVECDRIIAVRERTKGHTDQAQVQPHA
jgi:hypothetical protein